MLFLSFVSFPSFVSEPRPHGPSVRLRPVKPGRKHTHPRAGLRVESQSFTGKSSSARRTPRPVGDSLIFILPIILHILISPAVYSPASAFRHQHFAIIFHSGRPARPAKGEHTITPGTVMCPGNTIVKISTRPIPSLPIDQTRRMRQTREEFNEKTLICDAESLVKKLKL